MHRIFFDRLLRSYEMNTTPCAVACLAAKISDRYLLRVDSFIFRGRLHVPTSRAAALLVGGTRLPNETVQSNSGGCRGDVGDALVPPSWAGVLRWENGRGAGSSRALDEASKRAAISRRCPLQEREVCMRLVNSIGLFHRTLHLSPMCDVNMLLLYLNTRVPVSR